MSKVVTRFAPSPTGFMHVGGVRTALFAWLWARKNNGTFILRLEDTDKKREVEGSAEHIVESLKWLGIEWDEGVDIGGPHAPYKQSDRLDSYKKYAQILIEKGLAYPDPYTSEELETFRQQAESNKQPFLYRNHRPEELGIWDGTQALRLKVPEVKSYKWQDAARGDLSAGPEALDDFILIKSDGYPTYNFSHIVDDLEMGVTHIMRSDEFISSTPRFLSLYDALGITPPVFVTLPPILNDEGNKKLGKRDGAKDILEYRDEGYLPEAMMNFLALLGWNPGTEQEYFTKDELITAFTLDRIQTSGAHFNQAKLLSVNQHWMRKLSDEEFVARGDFGTSDPLMLRKVVPLLKERAHTFGEAADMLAGELSGFFSTPELDKEKLLTKAPADRPGLTSLALEALLEAVKALPDDASAEVVKEALMPLADAEEAKGKGGRGAVLWPLRYTLSGQERSPDPFTLVALLGKDEAGRRVEKAIGILE